METRRWLKRLIVLHRWLGVGLCVFFFLWFLSGIGMMYWQFPSVSAADRLDRSSSLDPDSVRLTAAEAFAKSGLSQPATDVRLFVFDGRPAYRFRSGRQETVVYADSGVARGEITTAMMLRRAMAWVGRSVAPASIESIDDVDQWTIQLRAAMPLWKYTWPTGEQVYVSQTSGEVVQYTTSAARLRAYIGPIPHWLYFTPLRKHGPQWSALVIGLSAVGTAAAVVGIIVGLSVRMPYRGPKRWHIVLGLIFGLGAVTWAFSGMLSMDPFPSQRVGQSRPDAEAFARVFRGNVGLAGFDAKSPRDALTELTGLEVRELELAVVAGKAFYVASLGRRDTRVVPLDAPAVSEFEPQFLEEAVIQAARLQPARLKSSPTSSILHQYDRYYLDRRRELPIPVIRVRLNDRDATSYYVDPKTARIVGTYSSRDWMTRWAYHGLHSLNFPWLYNHRPLWDIVVMTFMVGGAALSVTSMVLAWDVLGRWLRGRVSTDGRHVRG